MLGFKSGLVVFSCTTHHHDCIRNISAVPGDLGAEILAWVCISGNGHLNGVSFDGNLPYLQFIAEPTDTLFSLWNLTLQLLEVVTPSLDTLLQ